MFGKKSNGITLIALVITIIVLLILASVTINSIIGSENIMEKAKQAKIQNEKAEEFENIKLITINAIAYGKTGTVSLENLKKALLEITDIVDETQTNALNGEGPWMVTGKKAAYLIKNDGEVILLDGTESSTIVDDIVTLGEPINQDKYGYLVGGYTSKYETENEKTIKWRLFYQDNKNTYIIADVSTDTYRPNAYYTATGENRYTDGSKVSGVGKGLNEAYYRYKYDNIENWGFTSNNTADNIRATAWMTDTSNELWTRYKDIEGKAQWAIASPTVDLFVKSYNAVAALSSTDSIYEIEQPTLGQFGGDYPNNSYPNNLDASNATHKIYNIGSNSSWWIASPCGAQHNLCFKIDGRKLRFGYPTNYAYNIRPIVCISTTVFNSTYTLTND